MATSLKERVRSIIEQYHANGVLDIPTECSCFDEECKGNCMLLEMMAYNSILPENIQDWIRSRASIKTLSMAVQRSDINTIHLLINYGVVPDASLWKELSGVPSHNYEKTRKTIDLLHYFTDKPSKIQYRHMIEVLVSYIDRNIVNDDIMVNLILACDKINNIHVFLSCGNYLNYNIIQALCLRASEPQIDLMIYGFWYRHYDALIKCNVIRGRHIEFLLICKLYYCLKYDHCPALRLLISSVDSNEILNMRPFNARNCRHGYSLGYSLGFLRQKVYSEILDITSKIGLKLTLHTYKKIGFKITTVSDLCNCPLNIGLYDLRTILIDNGISTIDNIPVTHIDKVTLKIYIETHPYIGEALVSMQDNVVCPLSGRRISRLKMIGNQVTL